MKKNKKQLVLGDISCWYDTLELLWKCNDRVFCMDPPAILFIFTGSSLEWFEPHASASASPCLFLCSMLPFALVLNVTAISSTWLSLISYPFQDHNNRHPAPPPLKLNSLHKLPRSGTSGRKTLAQVSCAKYRTPADWAFSKHLFYHQYW